jgi:hypothetical protein
MKTPSPPKSEEPLVNPYRAQSRLCWWLALSSLVVGTVVTAAILALATERALVVIPIILGASGLISAVISALVFAYYAPLVERHLEEFRRGDYLAHWSYEYREWARFAEAEWAGKRAEAHRVLIVFGALGLLIGVCLWLRSGMGPLGLVVGGATGAAVGALIGSVIRHAGERAYRRAVRRVGETYIGPEAAYVNGTYHCWATWGIRLLDVSLHQDERTVLSMTIGMTSKHSHTLRVLVPSGREHEAKQVVRLLG